MIFAFTGKAGAGKTTASDYLVENHKFTKINFKDALVAEMRVNFPDVLRTMGEFYLVSSHVWSEKFKDRKPTQEELTDFLFIDKPPIMRALMQNYGTEVRRKDNDKYWVDQWASKVYNFEGDIVVDDCRFLNEADAVKLLGGTIIKVDRTDYLDRLKHSSETEQELINHDLLVKSKTGGHKLLYEQLETILNEQSK